jgi:hypothetical protein
MPFRPRCAAPTSLVRPVPIDPTGEAGPTSGQARGPRWRRTSPGRYVPAGTDDDVVEQRILEQAARLPDGGVVGGWAALRLAGGGFFDGLARDGRTPLDVPLLVPPGGNLRRLPGCQVSRERVVSAEKVVLQGIACAHPVRAVFDEARRARSLRDAVVALDMVLVARLVARLVTLEQLTLYFAGRPNMSGCRQAREALRWCDPRSLSPEETDLRLVWEIDAGLPRPRCNWTVSDLAGHRLGMPDLLSNELGVVGEYDGGEHRYGNRRAVDADRLEAFRDAGLESFVVVGAERHDRARTIAKMHAAVRRAEGRPRRWMIAVKPPPLRIE